MTATPAPTVRRHHWIVRLTHWATVVVLAGMIASGLQIYEAYARFGNRGGPYFVSPFDGAQFPHWSRLGGWLAQPQNAERVTSELATFVRAASSSKREAA